MQYIDLFHNLLLNEHAPAPCGLRSAFRSWYNIQKNEFVLVMDRYRSHADVVKRFPEDLGLDPIGVQDLSVNEELIAYACLHGWIRVAAQHLQRPYHFMCFEGRHLSQVRELAQDFQFYFMKSGNKIQNLALEILDRKGQQTTYLMLGEETVSAFVDDGSLPPPVKKGAANNYILEGGGADN